MPQSPRPELKSYYVAPFGESGTIQLDNSEHGTITIRPDTPIQGRANGDPVIHGTYTVEYNSIGSHFEYKVDTNSSYKITAAYDLDYTTVHEILSHSLTHTSTMASLKIEFKYFSVAGTANAYLNFVIRNGKIYVETKHVISTYATGRYNNGKINWNSVTNSRSVSIVGSFFLFAKHLFNPAFHFYFYSW